MGKLLPDKVNMKLGFGKKECIVYLDLHKRDYQKEWQDYKNIENELRRKDVMICTDYPEEARRFFDD